jgi:hypothetical protein
MRRLFGIQSYFLEPKYPLTDCPVQLDLWIPNSKEKEKKVIAGLGEREPRAPPPFFLISRRPGVRHRLCLLPRVLNGLGQSSGTVLPFDQGQPKRT